MSSKAEQWLCDIRLAIGNVRSDTAGMTFEAFRSDGKTVRAVERSLQIISEAAIRLGPEAERLCPGLPWRSIRGIGNWLRHQYDGVDVQTVWDTVLNDLPPLAHAVSLALEQLQSGPESPDAEVK